MKEYEWVPRPKDWIKDNPGKGTMYKHYLKDGEPPVESCALIKKEYKKLELEYCKKERDLSDSGIYVIICEPSKRAYVGQSMSMSVRMRNHKMIISGSNIRNNETNTYKDMISDFNLYGISAFSFIKHKSLPGLDAADLMNHESNAMGEFIELGYRLYNLNVNIGNNVIYCPPDIIDWVRSLIVKCKNNTELMNKIDSL
jgi:hypothetical protein